jgi:creatinine amidohydrolase
VETKVEYELMTPDEVIAAREKTPVAFVPIGPIEWHGPHLPLGTDGLHAHGVAVRAARIVGGVVLPTLYAGTETVRLPGTGAQQLGAIGFRGDERIVGMDFPHNPVKSLYYEESAFGVTVREVVRGLKADPFRLIVLLNGHGAVNHQRTLRRIAIEETEWPRVRVLYQPAWQPPGPPQSDPGHAEKWETSILLALAEPYVKLSNLPNKDQPIRYQDYGIIDGRAFDGSPTPGLLLPTDADPRYAERDAGERILDEEVRGVVEEVHRHLDEIRSAVGP